MVAALTILHIAVAAAWFGHKLLIPGDIRATIGEGFGAPGLFLRRLQRAERVGIFTGLGTLLSGAALWWVVGWGNVGPGVWIGAGLVMGAIVVGVVAGRPASKRLRAAVEAGDRVEAVKAGGQVGRVLTTESLLWIGALTAMVL